MSMSAVIGAVLVFFGTGLQALLNLRELGRVKDAEVFRIIDKWKQEVPWFRLRRRLAQLEQVRALLRENPMEAGAYWRVNFSLWGWTLMCLGSAFGILAAWGL